MVYCGYHRTNNSQRADAHVSYRWLWVVVGGGGRVWDMLLGVYLPHRGNYSEPKRAASRPTILLPLCYLWPLKFSIYFPRSLGERHRRG